MQTDSEVQTDSEMQTDSENKFVRLARALIARVLCRAQDGVED